MKKGALKIFKLSLQIWLGLFALIVNAQQDSQYTQYMFNTMSVNPAYAGSRGMFSFTGMYRNQWLGLDGAPETQTLNFHTPVRNSKFGVGVSVINDKIGNGVNQETNFDIVASYTVETSYQGKLSFGLKAGANLLNIDFTKLNQYDDVEFTEDENIDNKISPNIGAGVYYHTDSWYVGLSVPNLIQTQHFQESANGNTSSSTYVAKDRINYYLIGGYVFDLNYMWQFKPTVLTKVVAGAPMQFDLSANFLYDETVTMGIGYRFDAAITAMLGFQLNRSLNVGLAYDREITELGGTQFNSGTMEFFLRFELFRNYRRITTPRFF
ncbi:PorP/SprF family type IX secretion system membrane protein [Robertkochia solimangrovi]|uniref:PorP/SprF family type IX secretion system membrane protein n=1 Tax=Robertkochia solimangrovi TaxID=2213046 RepID=UPI00117CD32B|nr:type IX secretion system membrane protein PorP/SprF [Robertkochia solimangrovi]TRZ41773.1 hypothetical protein DMZ48_15610 [Robertkochia solimangrovi]